MFSHVLILDKQGVITWWRWGRTTAEPNCKVKQTTFLTSGKKLEVVPADGLCFIFISLLSHQFKIKRIQHLKAFSLLTWPQFVSFPRKRVNSLSCKENFGCRSLLFPTVLPQCCVQGRNNDTSASYFWLLLSATLHPLSSTDRQGWWRDVCVDVWDGGGRWQWWWRWWVGICEKR